MKKNVKLKFCGKTKAKITMMLPHSNGLQSKYMQLFLINIRQSLCIFLEAAANPGIETSSFPVAYEHCYGWA